jgi:hypothetical protein
MSLIENYQPYKEHKSYNSPTIGLASSSVGDISPIFKNLVQIGRLTFFDRTNDAKEYIQHITGSGIVDNALYQYIIGEITAQEALKLVSQDDNAILKRVFTSLTTKESDKITTEIETKLDPKQFYLFNLVLLDNELGIIKSPIMDCINKTYSYPKNGSMYICATNCIIKNNLNVHLALFQSLMTEVDIADLFYGIGLESITPLTEGDVRFIYKNKNNEIQFTVCTMPCNFTFDVDVMFSRKLTVESKYRRLCVVFTANFVLNNLEYTNCKNIVEKIYLILYNYASKSSLCKIISNYTEFPLYSFKSQNNSVLPFYKFLKSKSMAWTIEEFVNNPIILAKKYDTEFIVVINRPLFTQSVTCELQHLFLNYHTLSDYIEVGRVVVGTNKPTTNISTNSLVAYKTKNGFIVTRKNITIQDELISLLYIPMNLFQCDQNLWSINVVKTYPLNSCVIDVVMSSLSNVNITLIFETAVYLFYNNEKCDPVEKYSLNAENSLKCPAGNQCDFNICTFDNMYSLEKALLPLNGRLTVDSVYKLKTNQSLAVVRLLLNSTLPVYVLIGNSWSKTCVIEVSLILQLPSLVRDVIQRWQLVPYLTNCLL